MAPFDVIQYFFYPYHGQTLLFNLLLWNILKKKIQPYHILGERFKSGFVHVTLRERRKHYIGYRHVKCYIIFRRQWWEQKPRPGDSHVFWVFFDPRSMRANRMTTWLQSSEDEIIPNISYYDPLRGRTLNNEPFHLCAYSLWEQLACFSAVSKWQTQLVLKMFLLSPFVYPLGRPDGTRRRCLWSRGGKKSICSGKNNEEVARSKLTCFFSLFPCLPSTSSPFHPTLTVHKAGGKRRFI